MIYKYHVNIPQPSEESLELIENSNFTINFPINDKSSDRNNCKNIFFFIYIRRKGKEYNI